MNLEEFREKYPMYNDMPDEELADAFHAKYYSDMSREDFFTRIDFTPPVPQLGLVERITEPVTEFRREQKIKEFRRGPEEPYEPPIPPGMVAREKQPISEKFIGNVTQNLKDLGMATPFGMIAQFLQMPHEERMPAAKELGKYLVTRMGYEIIEPYTGAEKYKEYAREQPISAMIDASIILSLAAQGIGLTRAQGLRGVLNYKKIRGKIPSNILREAQATGDFSKITPYAMEAFEGLSGAERGKIFRSGGAFEFEKVVPRFPGKPPKPTPRPKAPKKAPEVAPREAIKPEGRALVPKEPPVARTMKELRGVEAEFPRVREVEEFPAKPPEPTKVAPREEIVPEVKGEIPKDASAIIELVQSQITAEKGLERGLDYYKGLVETLPKTDQEKVLEWTASHENDYIRRRLGGDIAAILRKPPPPKVEKPPAKEPWEMTSKQYTKKIKAEYEKDYGEPMGEPTKLVSGRTRIEESHFKQVQQALSEGKPVPKEVLADYPELIPAKEPTPALPEGYKIQEVAGKFDVYRPDGELAGTRTTEKAAIAYANVHAKHPKPKVEKVEQELGKQVDEVIGDIAPQPGLTMRLKKKPTRKAEGFKFSDAEIESRYLGAKGVQRENLFRRVGETFRSLKNKATREYEHLPRTKEFAQLRFDLLRLSKQKGVSSDRTLRAIQGITIGLDKNSYDLFTRKVILDDLEAVAAKEKALPLGFDKDSLATEKGRVDAEVSRYPDVAASVEKRKRLWTAIREDYGKAMDAIGFDVSKRLQNENYFRHQVLEYANAKGLAGAGKRLRTPTYRGFLKKRKGSRLDINTDYLEAEHEVMAQMLHDIEVARTIRAVEQNYDISGQLKKEAAKQKVPWQSLVPEGYTTWQPREGSVFYMADSIPANIAKELTAGALEQVGISKEEIHKVLAMGRKRKEFAIKEEIAVTLDNLMLPHAENVISQANKKMLRAWKVWTLVSPRRWAKYNFRNLTGDADAAFMGNPKGFKHVTRAVSELYDVYAGDKAMTPDLKDWFERGGMQSTLQAQEMGELKKLKMFIDKYERRGRVTPKALWQGYWKAARLTTDFREATLRYSNYLEYLGQMKKAPKGNPKNFGASIPDEVMGLKDIKDRAFMLSNDLLGAYDRVSVMGHALREHLYPFWSWKEVNFKRYLRLFKNAADNRELASLVGKKAKIGILKTPYTTFRIGRFIIKALAFWGMLQVWNHLMFPEEEASLSDEQRTTPHIIFGRDRENNIIWFPRVGALGDFLEWFGLDQAPDMAKDWYDGTKSLAEIIRKMGKSFVNVVVQGVTPFIKTPFEIITRRSLFPDVFRPGTVRDRGYHIARSLGLENEYKAIMDLPMEPYKRTMPKLFVYKVDPYAGAYRDILEERRRFMKKVGKYGEGFWINPRGNALYHFKMALRYGDKQAAQKYIKQYIALGGTPEGMEQSLQRLFPLVGLNEDEMVVFVNSLSRDNRLKLVRAVRFYSDVLLGQKKSQPQVAKVKGD